MKLLTLANLKSLPPLYSQDGKGKKAIAKVKFFAPWSNWTWYATEYDPREGKFFGLVDGHVKELGYFTLYELTALVGPGGLRIERDKYFEPTALEDL